MGSPLHDRRSWPAQESTNSGREEGPTKALEKGPDPLAGPSPRRRRGRLSEAQQALADRCLPLARSLAWKAARSFPQLTDDLLGEAMLALTQAAESFDPSRNVKFTTFARYRITGAIRDTLRRQSPFGYQFPCGEGEGQSQSQGQERRPPIVSFHESQEEEARFLFAEHDPPIGADLEATEDVDRWLRKLPKRHAAICREIYVNGLTQGKAAARLGCSKSRLSYLHKEALDILAGELRCERTPEGKRALC